MTKKILLISDTHGDYIDRILELAEVVRPDFCIHSGDFGFYKAESLDILTPWELRLRILHSPLPQERKKNILKGSDEEKRAFIRNEGILGSFGDYLAGEKTFPCDVYAIWGNHDDSVVVQEMIDSPVTNLHVMTEHDFIDKGSFYLMGTGGNCVLNRNTEFVQADIAFPGHRCRPKSTLFQWIRLLNTAKRMPADKPRVLAVHVSPLYERFLELVAWQAGAVLTVSGHMGYPDGETGETRLENFDRLQETYQKLCSFYPSFADELAVFQPERKDHVIRHVNLPNAVDGYGILTLENGHFEYEIRGKSYPHGQA